MSAFRYACVSWRREHTGLRVKEVDYWDEYSIKNSEHNPKFPSKILDAYGCYFNNNKVGKPEIISINYSIMSHCGSSLSPVSCRGHSSALCPHGDRVDFGRI